MLFSKFESFKKLININKDDYQSGLNNKNFFILCLQSPFITEGYQLKLELLILKYLYIIYPIYSLKILTVKDSKI